MDQIEEMTKQQDKMCEKLQKAEEAKQACHSAGCREEKTKQVQKEKEEALKEWDSAQSPWQNLRKIAINEFEPPETKPQEEKSEFDLDGAKKVLAKYTKMRCPPTSEVRWTGSPLSVNRCRITRCQCPVVS